MSLLLPPLRLVEATAYSLIAFTVITVGAGQLLPSISQQQNLLVFSFAWCSAISLLAYFSTRPLPLLLLDYACFRPDSDRRMSLEFCEYIGRRSRRISPPSEEFLRVIYAKSGLGDETYGPPFMFQPQGVGHHDATHAQAIQEAEEGMFAAVDAVLSKSMVKPSEIDVVIVGCSMFTPCPSLTSLLVNHYGMSPSVKTYNLSGMGCSAGTVGVDMATRLLRGKPGLALLVVTENTSLNWYFGDYRPMLVTNCIFRVGASAALLTTDPARRYAAKMELVLSMRTHHGCDDRAYGAAIQREDDDGIVGVELTKDLVRVAGAGLRDHIRILAPRVLPISEMLRYACAVVKIVVAAQQKNWIRISKSSKVAPEQNADHNSHQMHRGEQQQIKEDQKTENPTQREQQQQREPARKSRPSAPPSGILAAVGALVPDFTRAFEHMCIHTGGKAVIDTVGRLMRFPAEVIEPARMTLHRFGNTSSSLVFYQLAYFEAKGRIRRGDRVWMLAFGTGFKACSVVWRALKDLRGTPDNPWNDCVHRYPVA